jgi:hypothetical protein
MNKRFLIGVLMGFLLPSVLLVSVVFVFLKYGINQEDPSFESAFTAVDGKQIAAQQEDVVVVIVSTGCPGNNQTIPVLKEHLATFKENNIKYLIVADEIFSPSVDESLRQFLRDYELEEDLFLMDNQKYPNNSGYFNAKRRYLEFVNDLTEGKGDSIPLGYTNYIVLKEGRYLLRTSKFTSDAWEKLLD